MILLQKAKHIFLKCVHDNNIKYFHESVNIAVILAPGHEFFFAKCAQLPLTFKK